ncbi:envelope stress response membrane protein PspC [Enterobacteriaceae bacterium ESL0689]|nr:envelope stress response membrane protein PspC [Enterobacteriaceae bacterium ESL0689]
MDNQTQHKKLWRIPQQGMVKGVCAGIAQYLDVPVKAVRLITLLAMVLGLFLFVLVVYIILAFTLDPLPEQELHREKTASAEEILTLADQQLAASERRLREMERYVTSETFTLRRRFRQL